MHIIMQTLLHSPHRRTRARQSATTSGLCRSGCCRGRLKSCEQIMTGSQRRWALGHRMMGCVHSCTQSMRPAQEFKPRAAPDLQVSNMHSAMQAMVASQMESFKAAMMASLEEQVKVPALPRPLIACIRGCRSLLESVYLYFERDGPRRALHARASFAAADPRHLRLPCVNGPSRRHMLPP